MWTVAPSHRVQWANGMCHSQPPLPPSRWNMGIRIQEYLPQWPHTHFQDLHRSLPWACLPEAENPPVYTLSLEDWWRDGKVAVKEHRCCGQEPGQASWCVRWSWGRGWGREVGIRESTSDVSLGLHSSTEFWRVQTSKFKPDFQVVMKIHWSM